MYASLMIANFREHIKEETYVKLFDIMILRGWKF